ERPPPDRQGRARASARAAPGRRKHHAREPRLARRVAEPRLAGAPLRQRSIDNVPPREGHDAPSTTRGATVHVNFRIAAVLLAALTTVGGAEAKSSFPPSVCALLTAKQATALGATAKCTNQAPLPAPGSTQYVGSWAGSTTKSPSLQVTVSKYT